MSLGLSKYIFEIEGEWSEEGRAADGNVDVLEGLTKAVHTLKQFGINFRDVYDHGRNRLVVLADNLSREIFEKFREIGYNYLTKERLA